MGRRGADPLPQVGVLGLFGGPAPGLHVYAAPDADLRETRSFQ